MIYPQISPIEAPQSTLRLSHASINNRLIGEYIHFAIQSQVARGMQLRHKDDDHLLLRIDCECGVEEASPAILTDRKL
jgi:hypothetical protein